MPVAGQRSSRTPARPLLTHITQYKLPCYASGWRRNPLNTNVTVDAYRGRPVD